MTDFYSEVDQNGKTGQPGQVKSYECGYISKSNAELEAKEAGYGSLEDYLKSWWDEVSVELPFTWETMGSGYGYNGTTIFTNEEPDGGTLRCKDIFGQIMFDVYPPQEQPQPDQPIQITGADIQEMIYRGAMKILESIDEIKRTGTSYGDCSWCPFSPEDPICAERGLTDEVAEQLAANGVIPAGLVNRDFDIQASCDCTRGTDPDSGPFSNCGNKSYYGEYDEAVSLINQVTDESVKQTLMDSLNSACEGIECERFEDYEPDPDEKYETMRDMGEGTDRYVKPPFEYPQPTEPAKQWGGLYEGREYDTWLGHSDIPGSDGRFFNIVFYLDQNGQINYRCNGDSNQTNPEPYMPTPGGWLDKQIREYMASHIGEIKANLFI